MKTKLLEEYGKLSEDKRKIDSRLDEIREELWEIDYREATGQDRKEEEILSTFAT